MDTKTQDALKLAIKALENSPRYDKVILALEACKAALAEQQNGASPLRQPLSDDEINKISVAHWKKFEVVTGTAFSFDALAFARAIERAHGIGE